MLTISVEHFAVALIPAPCAVAVVGSIPTLNLSVIYTFIYIRIIYVNILIVYMYYQKSSI